ncbi:MAG: D-2-hydroxyacid dehydrogenase [Betaproteobacteria bacterium]|nr:D-2-hydroxyacid dehydrogenase [Betaproteobacteria bacterium]
MTAPKIRVHVENARSKAALHQITPAQWDAACARHPELARRLEASLGWDGDVLEGALRNAEIVIGVPALRERLSERAPRLKWLHATSAGVDRVLPLDWLPKGVAFTNNRGAHGAKAEQFMRMAYSLLHMRMPEIVANQHARRWQQLFSPGIAGKTALVIGLGDLGMGAVRAAKQLGLKVIGVSRGGKKVRHADAVHAIPALDGLLPEADFVVLAVPLTPGTRHLLDRSRLDLMKPTAGVINIARAAVADYTALAEKLERGELAGAVLDVVEPEPLPQDSPLWGTRNLIITPHISCDDGDHYMDITLDLWFANLARYVKGQTLRNRVDPRRGY